MSDDRSLIEEMRRRREPARATERLRGEVADHASAFAGGEEEDVENRLAFGAYRGVRERALHLEFQRRRGSWPALGYAWLYSPEFVPSGSHRGQVIVLRYATGHTVTLRGRNLRPLHERILRQQVYRVTEMGEEADGFQADGDPILYAIDIRAPEDEAAAPGLG